MHNALYVGEILLNIFGHCHPADPSWTIRRNHSTADLAALARTCRTFKEPALDVLWSELIDLSPLAYCLPESHESSGGVIYAFNSTSFTSVYAFLLSQCYSFTGPRNDAEWDTLRGYTRRVWRIVSFSSPNGFLDHSCISTTFNPSLADPLFPNLRSLIWQGMAALPATYFALPSLTSLDIRGAPWEDVSLYTNLLDIIVPRCPNIKKVRIQAANGTVFSEAVYRHLCHWKKLQIVDCLDVAFPANVIPHLSSISTLTWLSFTLSFTLSTQSSNPIPPPSSPLVFSQLVYLEIISELLESVTSLITHGIRLPIAQVLIVSFPSRPSKATVKSYLTTVHNISSPNSLMDLRLLNLRSFATHIPNPTSIDHTPHDYRLNLDDIRPCTAFSNLRAVHINLEWSIDLTDNDLLDLVTTWPNIEHILINDQWGWRTANGITLDGLLRILQKCRLLWELCIAVSTQSSIDISRRVDIDFSSRKPLWLNVADSVIQPGSVPALGTLFSALGLAPDRFLAWGGSEMKDIPGADKFRALWRCAIS